MKKIKTIVAPKSFKEELEKDLLKFEKQFKKRKDTFYPWINGYVSGAQWVLAHINTE
jgi:hypothetical protein